MKLYAVATSWDDDGRRNGMIDFVWAMNEVHADQLMCEELGTAHREIDVFLVKEVNSRTAFGPQPPVNGIAS